MKLSLDYYYGKLNISENIEKTSRKLAFNSLKIYNNICTVQEVYYHALSDEILAVRKT